MRAGDLAQVEAREHGVPELDEAEPQPVAPRLRDVLGQPGVDQRGEEA